MEKLNFKIEVFEGPLDLMLHLISKHKLDINDIPISELLLQYLDYIELMKLADLEVSTEFLTMAAHLVYIKPVSLLPKHEDAQKLKKELEGKLIEYQLCKDVALLLKEKFAGFDIFVRQTQTLPKDNSYKLIHDKEELLKAYLTAVGKAKKNLPPPQSVFNSYVAKPIVSIKSRVIYLLNKLYTEGVVPYEEFFYCENKSEMVATFLGLLELIKSKRIVITEDNKNVLFNKSYVRSDDDDDTEDFDSNYSTNED